MITGKASGKLYMDDEITLALRVAPRALYNSSHSDGFSSSAGLSDRSKVARAFPAGNTVERIEIAGQASAPRRVVLLDGGKLALI